jgi:hypothetical protein
VSPRVQYETTCFLISDAIGNVSCSVAWGKGTIRDLDPHGARGA